MGSMRFMRIDPVEGSILNNFSFDSSPQLSLSKALGTDPSRFELRETREHMGVVHYEVWSAAFPTPSYPEPKMRLRGHMSWERPEKRNVRYG